MHGRYTDCIETGEISFKDVLKALRKMCEEYVFVVRNTLKVQCAEFSFFFSYILKHGNHNSETF